jgi:hypothetical protein
LRWVRGVQTMKKKDGITGLEQLLKRLSEAANNRKRVSIEDMFEVVGQKSFGPVLIFGGLIAFSPLSDVPGVATAVAVFILLTISQMLLGREKLWLPKWVLHRTVPSDKFQKALKWLYRPARGVDRVFRPRLSVLTGRIGSRVIAVVCVLIGLLMPGLQLVPFATHTAGAALTAFGLSLSAHDGLMALIAFIVTTVGAVFLGRMFL